MDHRLMDHRLMDHRLMDHRYPRLAAFSMAAPGWPKRKIGAARFCRPNGKACTAPAGYFRVAECFLR
jgi:hypothetical protein